MSYYYYSNGRGSSGGGNGFLSNVPAVTRNIILVNLIMFVFTLINEGLMVRWFGLFYPASRMFRPWQIVTHMFMHGGFWHILFNMYTLFLFGSVVERIIGQKKFLVFYFICGLGAAGLNMAAQAAEAASYANGIAIGSQAAVNNLAILKMTPTVGASGAIYGVLIAYAMLFPESKMTLIFPPVTLSAKWMVLVFAAIELFTGISGVATGIAHFAHLGGMLIGWLLIAWWRSRKVLFDKDKWI